jgi:hypothetical protein
VDKAILCPSWGCEAGAGIIGIVLADGSVAFSKERIVIDAAFVETAREGRSPEKRFRFSSTCKRAACVQWADDRCGIIDRILVERDRSAAADHIDDYFELPECSIRPQCRWHLQAGDVACRACPEVITDRRPENVAQLY